MIRSENISESNFEELLSATAVLREDVARQDEALADIEVLREFAMEKGMFDEAVQCFLEEALIWQHKYMESGKDEFLKKMEEIVVKASEFIKENRLQPWESRIARFLGRVADYQKKYSVAESYYQEAIDKAPSDPKYAKNQALIYEYIGFKILDEIRLGKVDEGIDEAEGLYGDYLFSEEGGALRQRDYSTWAIWRSGLLINLCRTLIDLDLTEKYKADILGWLEKAEQDLKAPEGVEVWTDFSFRKNEISEVRETL
ncbi:MAG: hypothetical protein UX08_C0023G0004 [Candidatus Collierbacteria bacterium GW2011_GWB1_45_35]|uniref:Tetratricopeptide repeat protein n=1 Tax=Candidatus Collierbacteria bacterium GW2011_GWB2_45_17 TaxID=1618388 RepID=A0A837IGV8_9BACT|nr:MAG: hypothetical protein UW48_C0024G0003 [Microgenomates group bacterium GW2011_GWC1_44_23]KKT95374.1 MAG: hypothetical protein UW96_C0007G0003 [Candidatus Collierbacteria bacterium GW2011_GWA1_45_15]KKU00024.1 MAG: hypothetical protein UX01_C0007G0003 [Candidatus Collierbacteria bacterium GW2011_GWB2_45_17]KKU04526.1 MAG: hypothetical protein UX08_C0023G0004 [Candidatus Collierbacteria bacterium GW2011_GWB1_45_35]KKU06821.1 MAG: hypothetical protein UX11_C0026G0008 [Candidatus Collierbacte